jgi:hypothetical protein
VLVGAYPTRLIGGARKCSWLGSERCRILRMNLSTSPSSVCGRAAAACLILAVAPSVFAQHVSVGIKGGVPLTDVLESESSVLLFQAETKRYAIGPVLDIGLPLGFGIEVGAMAVFGIKSRTAATVSNTPDLAGKPAEIPTRGPPVTSA